MYSNRAVVHPLHKSPAKIHVCSWCAPHHYCYQIMCKIIVGVLKGRAKWCHTAGVCLQVWGASLKGQLPQVQREIVAVKEHGTHGLSITLPLRPAGKVSDSSEILHTVVNELADPRDIHVSIFGSVF